MKNIRFKWFFLLLLLAISVSTLIVSGTAIFLYRQEEIIRQEKEKAGKRIREIGYHAESYLEVVEKSLLLLTQASLNMDLENFGRILDKYIAFQPLIRAIYLIDETGKTIAIGTRDKRAALHEDYLGLDFSYSPLFNAVKGDYQAIWSDKFISTLSGDTSVGAAYRIGKRTTIAELSIKSLLDALGIITGDADRVWVVDRRGELVVDTWNREEGAIRNARTISFIERAMSGEKIERKVVYEDSLYYVTYDVSKNLGWMFLIGVPAGLSNELVSHTLMDILLLTMSFILIALVIFPFWSLKISKDIDFLRHQADHIAGGRAPDEAQESTVTEFKDLSEYMRIMYRKIKQREEDLKEVNQVLEFRVEQRTHELKKSNTELQSTLDNLNRMQDVLVQSEKHAALGRLVAGVAHELNTPIGNAVMALSSLKEERNAFETKAKTGLKKSDLDRFTSLVGQGVDIAERNAQRAAELIRSFKHVANDQTSSVRRYFDLANIIGDVLLTLRPTIKRAPHKVEFSVAEGIVLDSYPGVLGQVITNLVTNALCHAWDHDESGTVEIGTDIITSPHGEQEPDNSWVEIRVQDNGKGIPPEYGRKIFDPFFTSKMGSGGTGLGLNIVLNSATNVLGGRINYTCPDKGGTCFILSIPIVAPQIV